MLRAGRRLLRPAGRTAFFTIHAADGLTPWQRRRASRDGPLAVATARPYPGLLAAAGFIDVTEENCTAAFASAARGWIEQNEMRRHELVALIGEASFIERQAERRVQLAAVEDGVLRRSLFTARRP